MTAARLTMPLYLIAMDFFLKVTYGFLSRLFDLPSKFLVLFEEKNSCFSSPV
jgi:hypothetical protein